ncbi:ATP-binding protein [Flavobacterium sp. MXW15]|uniref:ATP-binding protein n=1 Tax=Xanthomonas chitinilytica TaxID=2989819 RepID=A0ABT3JYI7_9XANT|nr:ATP-binding protein [Xanthomonas sp. H13-6]MCW4455942.1 ATP-binding protein [Flavobacterium sp. MXW15]MCW4473541.1 ATP-binding protein [Xanthomonas sp. H13-6]
MRLLKFSVTNFRSITSAHSVALSNLTVFVGRNNEGKSNLMRALEAAMGLLSLHALGQATARRHISYNSRAYVWKRDFPMQYQGRKSGLKSIFRLEFSLDDQECAAFKDQIGVMLNGSLPLEVSIGKTNEPTFRVVKSGRGSATLSNKSSQIARFVAERIFFNYIPAVRTDKESLALIERMLSEALRTLENDQEYEQALAAISRLQQPILDEIGKRVEEPLKEFLPNIQSVRLEVSDIGRRHSLRQNISVLVNDGTETDIEMKGDGVKSLAALGLMKSANNKEGAHILVIEEPESHLHPSAIHQVNEIISQVAESAQVLITTHNPLFVVRDTVQSNVIVSDGSAVPARSINAIRDVLGIRASDNLTHANYSLVVEGHEDVIALRALLPALSKKLGKALKDNVLVIDQIGGASNLTYKVSLLKSFLCLTHVLLDHDAAGKTAFDKAEKDGVLDLADCTFTICNGMTESEFEDVLELSLYKDAVLHDFGVDLSTKAFRSNKKWSSRVRECFLSQGKTCSDATLAKVKLLVGQQVAASPASDVPPPSVARRFRVRDQS